MVREWRRALEIDLWLAAIGFAVLWLVIRPPVAGDALVYYHAVPRSGLYSGAVAAVGDSFLYSPAFAQAFAPFRLLGPETFVALWELLLLAVLVVVAGPTTLLFVPFAAGELLTGNIQILLGLAVLVGMRYPAAWSFVLLTKLTPGIGLLWFAVRGEWRSLGIALGVTALIAGVSFLAAPDLWADWSGLLSRSAGTPPPPGGVMPGSIYERLALAAVLVVVGARRDWPWLVPIACAISLPVGWWGGVCIAVGAWRLRRPLELELLDPEHKRRDAGRGVHLPGMPGRPDLVLDLERVRRRGESGGHVDERGILG